jgi:TrmH family RNA methyltransferase
LLLLGNESRGISPALQSLAVKRIRIPRKGGAESLNVAVAAGILLSYVKTVS